MICIPFIAGVPLPKWVTQDLATLLSLLLLCLAISSLLHLVHWGLVLLQSLPGMHHFSFTTAWGPDPVLLAPRHCSSRY